MATKRQAPSDNEVRQPSKRTKLNFQHQQRPAHFGKKSFKKAHPVNELKSTVRSLRRLLEKDDDLPANVRIEKERALQTAQRELQEAQKAKKRSDMIGKYHKVRFFERQKAERRLKKAKKELKAVQDGGEGGEEDRAVLEKRVKEAEVELNYALYFPLEKDYVSLFPSKRNKGGDLEETGSGSGKGQEVERQGDAEMLELVRKCMEEGTLVDLREGRLTGENDVAEEDANTAAPVATKKTKRNSRTQKDGTDRSRNARDEEESSDEDGGGFFE